MSRCPYCTYETPEPDDGDAYVRGWQEVAHMNTEHQDVIDARLRKVFGDLGFGAEVDE